MVDGTGLENQRGATHRGFESRPLRQKIPYYFYKNEIISAAGGAITASSSTAAANTAT